MSNQHLAVKLAEVITIKLRDMKDHRRKGIMLRFKNDLYDIRLLYRDNDSDFIFKYKNRILDKVPATSYLPNGIDKSSEEIVEIMEGMDGSELKGFEGFENVLDNFIYNYGLDAPIGDPVDADDDQQELDQTSLLKAVTIITTAALRYSMQG